MFEQLDRDDRSPVDTISERWGGAVKAGFTPVPNSLVKAQAELQLSPNEVVVILNLLVHWWHRDHLPRPRTTTIAKRSGLTLRAVQRGLQGLTKKGLVERIEGNDGRTYYGLDGLRAVLTKFAAHDEWYRPEMF